MALDRRALVPHTVLLLYLIANLMYYLTLFEIIKSLFFQLMPVCYNIGLPTSNFSQPTTQLCLNVSLVPSYYWSLKTKHTEQNRMNSDLQNIITLQCINNDCYNDVINFVMEFHFGLFFFSINLMMPHVVVIENINYCSHVS